MSFHLNDNPVINSHVYSSPILISSKGLTLMEVLVSMLLIGVFFTAALKLDFKGWISTKENRHMLAAGHLAEQYIEDIRLKIAEDKTNNFPPKDTSFTRGQLKLIGIYSKAYSPKDNSEIPNLKKLDLLITWSSAVGDSLPITTYIAKDF